MSDALSQIRFDNTYAELPERFYVKQDPARVPAPKLIGINSKLAEELSIDPHWLESPEGVAMLAGNFIPDGAEPLAQAYAGHQFGGFVPQLGDGRAILLGEVNDKSNTRRDIQLKGSGRTPFSRGGDGKAALGPVIREYIVSEAMAALGVPTTRALGAVTTGESVLRQEGSLPGAVFTTGGIKPYSGGHIPILRGPKRHRFRPDFSRLRHRAALPQLPGHGRPRGTLQSIFKMCRHCASGAHRPMDVIRVYPWGDEYRQYSHFRRNHRLRPVRLHRRLPSAVCLQLDRSTGTLLLGKPTQHGTLEPESPCGNLAASAGRQ